MPPTRNKKYFGERRWGRDAYTSRVIPVQRQFNHEALEGQSCRGPVGRLAGMVLELLSSPSSSSERNSSPLALFRGQQQRQRRKGIDSKGGRRGAIGFFRHVTMRCARRTNLSIQQENSAGQPTLGTNYRNVSRGATLSGAKWPFF